MSDHERPETDWGTPADTRDDEASPDDTTILPTESPRPAGHRRAKKQKRRGGIGCIVVLVIIAIVGVLGYWGVQKASSFLDDQFGPPDDYNGNGTGKVVVRVPQGAAGAEIGRELKDEGVIASVDAYLEAAAANPEARSIQPGYYKLAHEMSAEAALGRLLDSDFRTKGALVIPEGLRSDQVVDTIVDDTDLEKADVEKALKRTNALGLPGYADGDPEGFLYPGSYDLPEKPSAAGILRSMVQRAKTEHRKLGLEPKAADLGVSARDALIVASLIEREASRDQDRAKVARVIYNRLDERMPLQLDSTVHYVAERSGDAFTTDEERDIDSPYNTYKNTGLPPGPIDTPGAEAIRAALKPAKGDWTYFVTVNFDTGETLFATSLAEHNKNVDKLRAYCDESDAC